MKKLLTIIILSTLLLSASTVSAHTNKSYDYIARVSTVTLQNNTYYTTLIDENEEEWSLEADQDLSNKWLNIHSNNNGTSYLYDDEITGYEILED